MQPAREKTKMTWTDQSTTTMDASAKARVGSKMLEEVEEASLDEVLAALRAALETTNPPRFTAAATDDELTLPAAAAAAASNRRSDVDIASLYPIPALGALVSRNRHNALSAPARAAPLQLNGRYMPLVYELVSKLVASPCRRAVVIIDAEHRFDATRLAADRDDLGHVHVYRPARCGSEDIRELTAAAESWMLYGSHGSRAREWWGTVVIGAPSGTPPASGGVPATTVRVTASWKGWMRVDRDEVAAFPLGTSAREALVDRRTRQDAVDAAPWVATCQWGGFALGGQREADDGISQ